MKEEAEKEKEKEKEKSKEKENGKTVLEKFANDDTNIEETFLPKWLYKYLVFRFNLLDRTGN